MRRNWSTTVLRNSITWEASEIVSQKFDNKIYEHSYYTFAVLYKGDEIKGISWKEFYNQYKADGGDGFYGNVAIPYLEPALINKKIGKVINIALISNFFSSSHQTIHRVLLKHFISFFKNVQKLCYQLRVSSTSTFNILTLIPRSNSKNPKCKTR